MAEIVGAYAKHLPRRGKDSHSTRGKKQGGGKQASI